MPDFQDDIDTEDTFTADLQYFDSSEWVSFTSFDFFSYHSVLKELTVAPSANDHAGVY